MSESKRVCGFLVFFIAMIFSSQIFAMLEAGVSVVTVDGAGHPVSNVTVSVAFYQSKSDNAWDGLKEKSAIGISDTNGMVIVREQTVGSIGITAEHDGYYISRDKYQFKKDAKGELLPLLSPITIVMRKKESPVSLIAKKWYDMELPEEKDAVGYDLVVGDWVAPYGEGKESDFTVNLIRDYKSSSDYALTLMITTPRTHDGFFGISDTDVTPQSELLLPREAPESGYSVTNIVISQSSSTSKPVGADWFTRIPQECHFFFRIRTKVDDQGLVKEALYGKLVGPIECVLHDTKTGKLRLTYYLNPDANDRNLEFDPSQNIFKNLGWFEQVKKP